MKKSSNKYVNYGIVLALLGILMVSLSLNRMEGFEEKKDTDKPASKKKSIKDMDIKDIDLTDIDLKETLAQLQHLSHLAKKDDTKSV
jgi:hypothetical protein